MESILTSIKKLLGITEEDKNFDMDVIIHINSAFSRLHRLGVGPEKCYRIQDDIPTWSEFINDEDQLNDVKTYVYLKVKVIFDPPLSSAVLTAYKEDIKQLEWELNVTGEDLDTTEDEDNVEI